MSRAAWLSALILGVIVWGVSITLLWSANGCSTSTPC